MESDYQIIRPIREGIPGQSVDVSAAVADSPSNLPASDAELTIYPDADHDPLTRTFAVGSAVGVYGWMLGFTKP